MKRAILTPAALPTPALAELKQWLGITTGADDAPLTALLTAALETCEAFTGILPIEAVCDELLPACSGWQKLATRPVLAITTLHAINADGACVALPCSSWEADLDADGTGRVRASLLGTESFLSVRFIAGLASKWEALPDGFRHGLIRLAAHQHRGRDDDAAAPLPPASVAALWRPWRRMRLA
ncbi:head-tail connector protein [Novosphingobium guangzhouense]|uniref:Phage gp6-like head-tail connector protein n=1 Tax=Novosphingobium guangzhouense TaxID=1850347 RepID=A0A2K2G0T4_9SPHN|nr:hypothetical protein [Novosphingobium guangzhouense]PNU04653.1 hypothetical protein A8V01_18805 [Novosphingobium guangzhouense]